MEGTSTEWYQSAGMTYEEMRRINEELVLDRNSNIFNYISSQFLLKLGQAREARLKRVDNVRRRRLVVPYAITTDQSYELSRAFSQFDLEFKCSERIDGAYYRSVVMLTSEALFSRIKGKWERVVAYGLPMGQQVIHNRDWVHLCISTQVVDEAVAFAREDRRICSVLNASVKNQKPMPMTTAYAEGRLSEFSCANPQLCTLEAPIALVMLHKLDVGFLQLAQYMRQHKTRLCYFSVPYCKAMELGYDAAFPQLQADVRVDDENILLLYADAMTAAQTYRRKNYMSLLHRHTLTLGEQRYFKEFVGEQNGFATFKITCAPATLPVEPQLYRSWHTPNYADLYMITSARLVSDTADIYDAHSYRPFVFEADIAHVDKLMDYAMSVEAGDMTVAMILRRMRIAMTTSVVQGYNVVSTGMQLTEEQAEHLAVVIFVHCYMTKYVTGVTLSHLTGQSQYLQEIRRSGAAHLLAASMVLLVRNAITLPLSGLGGLVRKFYLRFFSKKDIPLPKIEFQVGYTTYSGDVLPKGITDGMDWTAFDARPWAGFSPSFPGFSEAVVASRLSKHEHVHAYYDSDLQDSLRDAMQEHVGGGPADDVLITTEPIPRGPLTESTTVDVLARTVNEQNLGLIDTRVEDLRQFDILDQPEPYDDAFAGYVDAPVVALRYALTNLFPASTLMQTQAVESDINYSSIDMGANVVRLKLDASKLRHLKPEYFFRPVIPNHVMPSAHQSTVVTLQTVLKRNTNTALSAVPVDVDELWDRTWAFMRDVYYVPEVDRILAEMEYIGPTYETIAVWASKLSESVMANLDTDFRLESLRLGSNKLMLKTKRKINLTASYDSTVKPPQSIQYDETKGRTAVFSPIFAEKVRRDKSVLRPNVFIMQSKSPADMDRFLSKFDWRPGVRGPLRYLEIDGEQFDKSQILQTLAMHWKKCEKFGVLPDYLKTLENCTSFRDASSVEAGIKLAMTPQRGSGDSDTLDGNCDVSQAAYARFFHRILSQIAFIMIMGDDVTVAYYGEIDIEGVEADVSKEFNLSVKITTSDYGYFVSGFLVHLPDGSIVWRTDPLKRAVSFGDQSVAAGADFLEKHVSLSDLCRGLGGYATQQYLCRAISARYGLALGVDYNADDVQAMIKSVVTLAADYKKYRGLFAVDTYKRFY